MEDNWNPDEWQGRDKKNVEDTLTAVGYVSIFLLLICALAFIVDLLKNLA